MHIERFLRVVFAYRKSLRPPMLLLSLKAGSHLWSSLNHALCGSVRYRSVSLDPMRVPHCCPLYGVPTRPKLNTASLQTEMRARAVNCCLAYYGCSSTSRLTVREAYCWVLVPCMETAGISDGFPPCWQLSVQWQMRKMVKLFAVG